MPTALAVAIGGAMGALSRWAVDGWLPRREGGFPWATFVVNVTGAFLVGLLVAWFDRRGHVPVWLRTGLTLGFVGAYTTFSTMVLESTRLIEGQAAWFAAVYLGGSVAAGFLALVMGGLVGRALAA